MKKKQSSISLKRRYDAVPACTDARHNEGDAGMNIICQRKTGTYFNEEK